MTLEKINNTNINSGTLPLDVVQELIDRLLNTRNPLTSAGGIGAGEATNITQVAIVGVISNVLGSTNNCSVITRASQSLTNVCSGYHLHHIMTIAMQIPHTHTLYNMSNEQNRH